MRVKIEETIHEARYFDGGFVDVECGQRISGTNGEKYALIWEAVNCNKCLANIADRDKRIAEIRKQPAQSIPTEVNQPTTYAGQPAQQFATGCCPECGATLWFEEGCSHCRACGFSKC